MKKSVVRKVFFSTVTLLAFTLFVHLFLQTTLMDDLYRWMKTKETDRNFDRFIDEYNQLDKDEELNDITADYYKTYLAPILVLSSDNVILNDQLFETMNYIVVDTGKQRIKVLIGNRADERGKLYSEYIGLSLNKQVEIIGGLLKGGEIMTLDGDFNSPLFEKTLYLKGKVIETHFVEKDRGVYSYQSEKLLRETSNLLDDKICSNQAHEFLETETGLNIRIRTTHLEDGKLVIGLFTIEDLSETFVVLNKYYIYIFFFQLVLFALLAAIYSRWITKPLRTLSKDAERISNLDFTKTSNVCTGDELEQLSQSLNRISMSMEKNIRLLKEDALKKEENEKRMRELLANLSHEFKTPLGIMSGFLEMMEATDDNKSYYIDTISTEIDKLNDLTKETLLLCESETIQSQKIVKIHPFKQIYSLDKFKKQLQEKSMILKEEIDSVMVICDSRKIQIAMDNLVSNAIKYSGARETISVEGKMQENDFLVKVKNTGITLLDNELERIWDDYYRTEKSRNKVYGGNGLGLSIAKNIFIAHDSKFGVYNEDNAVVFYFTLKVANN